MFEFIQIITFEMRPFNRHLLEIIFLFFGLETRISRTDLSLRRPI